MIADQDDFGLPYHMVMMMLLPLLPIFASQLALIWRLCLLTINAFDVVIGRAYNVHTVVLPDLLLELMLVLQQQLVRVIDLSVPIVIFIVLFTLLLLKSHLVVLRPLM